MFEIKIILSVTGDTSCAIVDISDDNIAFLKTVAKGRVKLFGSNISHRTLQWLFFILDLNWISAH